MVNQKILRVVAIAIILVIGSVVLAGQLASFDNPTVTACSLDGLKVSGTLIVSDTVHVEEYIEGNLNTTFTGRAGRYGGYVSYFSIGDYPYDWKATLSFKNTGGDIIEQYSLEVTCTALDKGTVTFREVDLSPALVFALD